MPLIGPRARAAGEPTPAIYAFPDLGCVIDALGSWLDLEDEVFCLLALHIPRDWVVPGTVAYEVTIARPVPAARIALVLEDVGAWDGSTSNEAAFLAATRLSDRPA